MSEREPTSRRRQPTAASMAPRAARLSGRDRREHFLDVASALIASDGVDAVTMESVAAAAGVSKGLGYAYFSNRGDLLLAVLEREMAAFDRRIGEAVAMAPTFEDRVRAATSAWFDALIDRGGMLKRLLEASQVQASLHASRNATYRRLEELWGRMAERELGVRRDHAVAAASILISGMTGVLERWTEAGDPRQMLEDTFVRLTMGGLRALAGDA